jgi:hypothetical protein
MSNPIKYNTLTETLALKKGNFWIGTGDVGKGTTASTGYYDGITPPVGGYTIYLNKASGGPQIHTAANDTQLIALTNIIAGASYTTANECFNYFAGQSDKMVVNREYESIVTSGLKLAYDGGFTASYPRNGTTWYNLTTLGNSSLNGGISYSSSNGGILTTNGSNSVIYAPSVNDIGAIPNQTFEIWVKSSGLGSGKTIGGLICPDYGQVSYIAGDGSVIYQLYNTDAWPSAYYMVSMGTSGVNCFDNVWHQIVCTRNSSDAYIYVDAVVRASTSGGGSWSGSTIWSGMATSIANNPNDAYYNLMGNVAIARIYNIALTQAQVTQNFNAQKGRFGL